MIPYRQLYWNGYNTAINWDLRADDVSPLFTPIYHAGGLAAFMMPIFCAGGTMVLHKSFDVHEVWRTIERERCTVVLGVPTIWKMLMEAPEFSTTDLSHVRWFISGGAPLPLALHILRDVVVDQRDFVLVVARTEPLWTDQRSVDQLLLAAMLNIQNCRA